MNTYDYSLPTLAPYINWQYFLTAWGLPARMASGAYVHDCAACRAAWLSQWPAAERGKAEEVLRLLTDARQMLEELSAQYQTHARLGILPAHSEGDNIIIRSERGDICLPLLRQQRAELSESGETMPLLCLADFIAPRHLAERVAFRLPLSCRPEDADFALTCASALGIFAATVDAGLMDHAADDAYRHLLAQTLGERLAEATAERLHEDVRRRIWGFAPEEQLTPAQLFAENYHGRRPAVGYPSLPDLSLNFLLDEIIDFSAIGIHLTENGMMQPLASVSGLILAHPAARHFAVGPIGEDQLGDYARRRGLPIETLRRFLKNLGF